MVNFIYIDVYISQQKSWTIQEVKILKIKLQRIQGK